MKEKVLTLLKSANYNDILLAFELMRSRMSVADIVTLATDDPYGRMILKSAANIGGSIFFRVTREFCVTFTFSDGTWLSALDLETYESFTNLGNHPEYDARKNKEIAEI